MKNLEIASGFIFGAIFLTISWLGINAIGDFFLHLRGCELSCEHHFKREFSGFADYSAYKCYCDGAPTEDPEVKAQEWKKES